MNETAITIVGDSAPSEPSASGSTLASMSIAPRSVGRYLLIDQVGKGGMGTVHSAFDPELERTVAIKLIYANKEPQERLRREAQAIARVSHPNVISVYDVGEFEFAGQRGVFMVMELVEGLDLRAWVQAQPRSVAELLAVFIQAGRGLEAAHQKGVIHRDFKPANVLVAGDDGRALVLDFGLARGVGAETGAETETGDSDGEGDGDDAGDDAGDDGDDVPASTADSASMFVGESVLGRSQHGLGLSTRASMLTAPLTQHGAIMGTPRYMSPEQHTTNVVDARSDQYSFCLALYIELYRKVPFDESGYKALAASKFKGISDWDSTEVPAHVQAALRRGLDPDPDQRWPDMTSLVDALADDPAGRRRRWLAAAVGAVALIGAVAGALLWDRQALAGCEDQRAWLEQAWSPDRRAAVEQAFATVDRSYAAKARDRALDELDRYGADLVASRAALCVDEHRGEVSHELFAARTACLDERHERLQAVAERLAEADEDLVEHAADVLATLPPLEPCATVERYAPAVDHDPEERRAIDRERFEIELIAAAGRQSEALARVDPLIERARALDDPHTLGLTLLRAGELVGSARDLERAEALLAEAAMLAERHGDHDLSIDALASLAHTLQDMRGRWDDAQRTLDFAVAKYAREPGGSAGEWRLHYVQAGIHNQNGRSEQAIAELEQAVAGARVDQPPMVLAKTLHALSFTEARSGALEQAEAHARESIELRVGVYGPEHPSLMYPLRALATIAVDRGRPEEALAHLDRAIALGERQFGRDAAGLIEPHSDKAKVLREMGRYQDALGEYDEALRLHQVNHKPAGEVLRLQSQVLLRLQRPEQALARAEQALAAHREAHGDDEQVPWLRSRFIMHRGEALLALGRHDEALRDMQRAAELRALEKSDGLLLRIWTDEGECLLAMGDRAGAAASFERARAHREAGNDDGRQTDARLDFALAQVSDDLEDRRRWARSAIEGFSQAPGDEELAEGVRAWLAANGGPGPGEDKDTSKSTDEREGE